MQFIGEHIFVGQLGNFFVVLSFIAALFASYSFYQASNSDDDTSWLKLARTSFRIHSFAVIGVVSTLFYMLANHYFEYHYIWQHSNKSMPMRYIFSSFWEGQEGSFLLWSFWHVVLGNILIHTAKKWEAPVLTTFSLIQAFISSMVLGIVVFGYKVGSNPFTVLMREHPDFANIPLFKMENYLDKLDGRGLNPLLQNYWMTIHPPTLFLGFASTSVPFCFAIAGLWKNKFLDWIKPALPWTFFGVMILGTGILMGGAWAYEALSFGGFWAWDPVENASLVPWLTMVAAGHVMLIQRKKGNSLGAVFFLTIITFVFILYSTYLTKSGILGESSVHAFTDLGMNEMLVIYLLFFAVGGLGLMLLKFKKFSKKSEEDAFWSREFWMFIGALVLLVSALQITFTTSIPVINKLFGTNMAPPIDAVEHYNKFQLPFAIIISFILGFSQFLKYKNTNFKKLLIDLLVSFAVSLFITILFAIIENYTNPIYLALFFTSTFAILVNLEYAVRILKGKLKKAGSSIAHIGFGLILLGALISTSKQKVISSNTTSVDITKLGEEFQNHENSFLVKGDTVRMADYEVVYKGKRIEGVNVFYKVDYFTRKADGSLAYQFTLEPRVQTNPMMGNVPEPDTKHFLSKDIYTHVTFAELEEKTAEDTIGYTDPEIKSVRVKDSLYTSNAIIVFDSVITNFDKTKYKLNADDIAVKAKFNVFDKSGAISKVEPLFVIRNAEAYNFPGIDEKLGLMISINDIDPEQGAFEISLQEKKKNQKEFIIMKAIEFPYINILWLGCVLMAVGTIIAVINRLKTQKA